MEVGVQLSVSGSYRPPVLMITKVTLLHPPQMIISLPDQTAVCPYRSAGTALVSVGVQMSPAGS